MKFTKDQAYKFGWEGIDGFAYNSKEVFQRASAAYFEVTKSHGVTKTTNSDRVYYIIDGKGEFTINKKSTTVEKGDVIIIPKNTFYDYKAINSTLKMFLVHTPTYDPAKEVKPK